MAKKKNKKFQLKLGIIIIILVTLGFLGFVLLPKLIEYQKLQAPISCDNPEGIKYFISKTWKDVTPVSMDLTKPGYSGNSIQVHLDNSSPYLELEGKNIVYYLIPHLPVSNALSYDKNILFPKLLNSGFYEDNRLISYSEPHMNLHVSRNGTDFIGVYTSQYSGSDSADTGVMFEFFCGSINQNVLNKYNEAISIPVVQENLKRQNIDINKVRVNLGVFTSNFLQLGMGGVNGSGAEYWFYKNQNGNWSLIFEGSQPPQCSLLENLHAPSGITCYRGIGSYSDTISKTK